LEDGYLFWRSVADGLPMLRGHAGDLLLPEDGSGDYGHLAPRLLPPGGRVGRVRLSRPPPRLSRGPARGRGRAPRRRRAPRGPRGGRLRDAVRSALKPGRSGVL